MIALDTRSPAIFWPAAILLVFSTLAGAAVAEPLAVVCHAISPLTPERSADDRDAEQAFCAIDFASASVAICPKTWSTSPAALVYDLDGTPWKGRAAAFEREVCAVGGHARDQTHREMAIFKNSLNGQFTSGTFAPASLLYYHFSRLLQTRVQVPVAVMAEFPVAEYRVRVVAPGLVDSDSPKLKMLHAGWEEMDLALSNPAVYAHRRELFTVEDERLWGVFLLQNGHRYGAELNGTRASGWGEGQNRDFQRTAPFIALRSDLPLNQAVSSAIIEARGDPAMADALPARISAAQVAWWMHEITEIVILDTLLGQQDRVGNIDYQWRWHWLEHGTLRTATSDPANGKAIRLRVSVLNDNDAGARSSYANYSQRTAMLDGWHHMDPGLYLRLQELAVDFRDVGPLAVAVLENYRLSPKEAKRILTRTVAVADQLFTRCENGQLRFDLGVADVLNPGQAVDRPAGCKPGEVPPSANRSEKE